jgi:hypothetical protein
MLSAKSAGHKALAHARWTKDEDVLVRADPSGLLRQGTDHAFI